MTADQVPAPVELPMPGAAYVLANGVYFDFEGVLRDVAPPVPEADVARGKALRMLAGEFLAEDWERIPAAAMMWRPKGAGLVCGHYGADLEKPADRLVIQGGRMALTTDRDEPNELFGFAFMPPAGTRILRWAWSAGFELSAYQGEWESFPRMPGRAWTQRIAIGDPEQSCQFEWCRAFWLEDVRRGR